MDTLTSMVVQVAQKLSGSDGISKAGLSPAWQRPFKVLGRTLDLQSADKQVGPYMGDLWNRVIMVFNPETGKPSFFLSSALMFGSTAAVYAFNRMSRSIWHVLTKLLMLWTTVYYDDFPMVEMAETAEMAEWCMGEVLDALGWKFAKTGSKAPPFSQQFDVLGVTVDLSDVPSGVVRLQNKASRVRSIVDSRDKLILEGRVEPGVAASLHGQLNFAQGQFLGAPLKPAMKFLGAVAAEGWDDVMRPQLAVVGLFVKVVMQHHKPRCISVNDQKVPVVVFTDGAWEPTAQSPAGAGFVVVDNITGTRVSHEIRVPSSVVEHWKQLGKVQLIAELELLPILIFFEHYKELCQNRRVILFIDNNAIRDAVAKGTSKALSVLVMLSELHRLWSQLQCMCWASRVPSLSNVADLPSRGQAKAAADVIRGVLGETLEPSQKLCALICDASSFVQMMRQHLVANG